MPFMASKKSEQSSLCPSCGTKDDYESVEGTIVVLAVWVVPMASALNGWTEDDVLTSDSTIKAR